MMIGPGDGLLAFEKPGSGSDQITVSKVAAALTAGQVPVVVLNACQSGAVGKQLEASVATALLNAGCAAVVAMAYSVCAVAAAEFMAAFYEILFTGPASARRSPLGGGCSSVMGGRVRRGICRWRTGWCRCTICARKCPSPKPAPPARPPRRRWMRRWTSSPPQRGSWKRERIRWPRWGCVRGPG
jgi:CHAT domain-containing protein